MNKLNARFLCARTPPGAFFSDHNRIRFDLLLPNLLAVTQVTQGLRIVVYRLVRGARHTHVATTRAAVK